jgi:hypothetical protein
MKCSSLPRGLLLALIVGILPRSIAGQRQDSTRRQPTYTQLAAGILTTTHFVTDSVRGYHIETRDLVVGAHQTSPAVPIDGFEVMELRSGSVEVAIAGRSARYRAGDYWFVRPEQRVAIRNLGELAVIHTLVLVPR